MNGLDVLASLLEAGTAFGLHDEALVFRGDGLDEMGRRKLKALKPLITALLLVELPDAIADDPCDGFDAAHGVAICRRCGHGLGPHFWRRAECNFFVGSAAEPLCRSCGIAFGHHVGITVARSRSD